MTREWKLPELKNANTPIVKEANSEEAKGRYCGCLMEPEVEQHIPLGIVCPFCVRWRAPK